ncbi:DUF4190 domain-containing protein [Prauserella muralis]|uniref:Uncharacterized protein n=1 Tax=Prauserella muralis TaxID=588067 RepID=A0A2V4B0B2_9PSEU|nr:DUF4190 domain-containing protein [Prauserella muralis]PXY27447.1 hypothetical protein BAY60_13520 [Prauserella muralis]TWE22852.1 hypothetical protein FHX69_4107 [Prauserella muralis]
MTDPQPSPHSHTAPPEQPTKAPRFGGLAWAALICGIVGVVGSPIIIFNNITAIAAGVGLVLGIIALFGTKKVLAIIGVVVCIAGIVITVLVQQAAVNELDEELRYQQECVDPDVLVEEGMSDWCLEQIGDAIKELEENGP